MSQENERGAIYINAAERAREILQHDITASYESCGHDANLLIVLFLQEIRDEWRKRERDKMKIRTIGQAATSVRNFPSRIYNGEQLEACRQLGPEIRRMVEKYLWALHDCKPGPPTGEEGRLEKQRLEAAKEERRRKAAAAKQAREVQQAQQAQQVLQAMQQAPPIPCTPAPVPLAAAPVEEAERPRKRAKKKQEYVPGVGTANYAFLIILYQAYKHGELFLGRQDLCDRAEASGLADKPIYGNGRTSTGPNNPANWYDGFTGFKKLTNNEPPLAMRYSTPIRCKLTPEGIAMAERLYRDAVQRGRMPEDVRIPFASLCQEAGNSAQRRQASTAAGTPAQSMPAPGAGRSGAQPAQRPVQNLAQQPVQHTTGTGPAQRSGPRPAVGGCLLAARESPDESSLRQRLMSQLNGAHATTSAALARSTRGVQVADLGDVTYFGRTPPSAAAVSAAQARPAQAPLANGSVQLGSSQPAPAQTPQVVEVLSDSEDEQPAQATPAADGQVAQLMDMGFTPEQAAQALSGGRTVEEAVEVLMISSDEEEPDQDAQQLEHPSQAPGHTAVLLGAPTSQQDSSVRPPGSSQPNGLPASMPGIAVDSSAPFGWAVQAIAAASRQQQSQQAAPAAATTIQPQQSLQHASSSAAALPRPSMQQERRPAAHPPQHPQVGRTASQLGASRASSGAAASASAAGAEHTGQRTRGIWRLPKLGGGWGIRATDIRLPPLPPGVPFRDAYQVVLVLDQREQFSRSIGGRQHSRTDAFTECSRQLSNLGIAVESRTSQTGDALWVARSKRDPQISYALDYVVERKSVKDLVGSIKNGRYERQKYVLQRCGLRRVLYLMEGNPDVEVQGSELKACKTAASVTEVVDGFEVLRTASVAETFRLYAAITKRLAAMYGPLTSASPTVQQDGEQLPTFEQLAQRVQANMKITVRDVWGLMLTALPGVGADLAEAILRVYPTPLSLRTAYEAGMKGAPAGQAVTAAQRLLEGIRVSPARKIGAQQSAKVFDTLFAAGWHCV